MVRSSLPRDEPDQLVVLVDCSGGNLRPSRERRIEYVSMISDRRAAAQRRAGDHGSIADRDVISDDNLGGAAAAQNRRVVARDKVVADGELTTQGRVDCYPLAWMADRADVNRLGPKTPAPRSTSDQSLASAYRRFHQGAASDCRRSAARKVTDALSYPLD